MLDGLPATRLDAENPPGHRGCYSIRPLRWACVYTHPQAEFWANSNLRRAGYTTFLPTHLVRQRDRVMPSMLHCVTRPLFPRYLFLRFDHLTASWSPIRATPGVHDLIRTGADVHYAPEAAVSVLQATQAQRATPTPDSALWEPGDAVAVATGVFHGCPAVVLSVNNDMAHVSLMMLGHLREVLISVGCLVARDAD